MRRADSVQAVQILTITNLPTLSDGKKDLFSWASASLPAAEVDTRTALILRRGRFHLHLLN